MRPSAATRLFKLVTTTLAILAAALYLAVQYKRHEIVTQSELIQFKFSDYFFRYELNEMLVVGVIGAAGFFYFYGLRRIGRPASRGAAGLAIALTVIGIEFGFWSVALGPFMFFSSVGLVMCATGALAGWMLTRRDGLGLARAGDAAGHAPVWAIVAAGAIVGTAASWASWRWIFDCQTIMSDSQSQIGQARLLLTGHFVHPYAQPLRDVLEIPYALLKAPAYSQFPPGYIITMAPVIAAGLPAQTVCTLAGGAMVALAALLAVRLAGRAAGIATVILLAGSPFLWVMGGTAMNHVPCAVALLGAACCWLPIVQDPDKAWPRWRIALGGLWLGWAVTMRPVTGLAHGIAWGAAVLAIMAFSLRREAPRWTRRLPRRVLVWGALGLALPAALFMFYNHETTGRALTMAYSTSNPVGHVLGFRASGPVAYSKMQAVHHLAASIFNLNWMLLGWAIGSWTALAVWWKRTKLSRAEWILLAMVATQVIVYGLYHFFDLFLGPRFLFELLPVLVVLAAIGLNPVLERGGFAAGATLALLGALAALSIFTLSDHEHTRYAQTVAQARKFDQFMNGLEPRRRPMVVVLDKPYNEQVGLWFPAIGDEQPIYFVLKANEARARLMPELRDLEWKEFDGNAE